MPDDDLPTTYSELAARRGQRDIWGGRMSSSDMIEAYKRDHITVNELRAYHDMPPLPGGDVVRSVWLQTHPE